MIDPRENAHRAAVMGGRQMRDIRDRNPCRVVRSGRPSGRPLAPVHADAGRLQRSQWPRNCSIATRVEVVRNRFGRLSLCIMHLDFGTVPAWVSGILSGASLFLALLIIQRDRAKDERVQVPRLVVVNERRSVKRDKLTHNIRLINTSEQSFYDVSCTVHLDRKAEKTRKMYAPASNQWVKRQMYLRRLKQVVRYGGRDDHAVMDGSSAVSTLEPHAEGMVQINLAAYSSSARIVITCKDASGRYWLVDPVTKATIRFEPFIGGVDDWG
jgi:hypothetical protein